eukprot:3255277-Pyramimonas_sp.AAC.1
MCIRDSLWVAPRGFKAVSGGASRAPGRNQKELPGVRFEGRSKRTVRGLSQGLPRPLSGLSS